VTLSTFASSPEPVFATSIVQPGVGTGWLNENPSRGVSSSFVIGTSSSFGTARS
jgi:hypothetical protein